MSKKLFVGNLDFKTKTEDLEDMFSEFGEIEECTIITDRNTNRSKGFGFVTFVEDTDADLAITSMHEKEINGRKLTVKEAEQKERSERPRFERREPEPEDEYSKFYTTKLM